VFWSYEDEPGRQWLSRDPQRDWWCPTIWAPRTVIRVPANPPTTRRVLVSNTTGTRHQLYICPSSSTSARNELHGSTPPVPLTSSPTTRLQIYGCLSIIRPPVLNPAAPRPQKHRCPSNYMAARQPYGCPLLIIRPPLTLRLPVTTHGCPSANHRCPSPTTRVPVGRSMRARRQTIGARHQPHGCPSAEAWVPVGKP
jgi:hypothetical protein